MRARAERPCSPRTRGHWSTDAAGTGAPYFDSQAHGWGVIVAGRPATRQIPDQGIGVVVTTGFDTFFFSSFLMSASTSMSTSLVLACGLS